MSRTTSTAVAKIIEVDANIPLTPFIEIASELVTEVCTNSGYSNSRLEMIERWLSAHFYSIRDKPIGSESAGVSASYNVGQLGMHLHSTTYGQQAMLLDTKGGLAALSKSMEDARSRTAQAFWGGTEL